MNPTKMWRRILNAIAPATVTQVDDTGPVLTLQLRIGYLETQDGRPVLQQFGFSSVPPIGSDAAIHFIAGDRSNGFVTGTNHQASRPRGRQPGEATVFNAHNMSIYLSAAGIVIDGGGMPVHIMNGDLHVDGAVIAGYGGADQVTVQHHTHSHGAAPDAGT